MDLRTGRRYESLAAARAAGVPASDIAEIVGDPADRHQDTGKIVRFASGPFKGRMYRRMANGQLVRVRARAGAR